MSLEARHRDVQVGRIGLSEPGDAELTRGIAIEAPVAIEVGGIGYAVMMATPADLVDYAIGFALAEGLVDDIAQILDIRQHEVEGGWVLRISLPPEGVAKAAARARVRVSESSCGLCGMDNIAQILRPLPVLLRRLLVDRRAISVALSSLADHQPLGRATGAAHAAAFCDTDGTILEVREDVGRHNALDKLVGALRRTARDPADGFILLTARCSYELVEKTVRSGCSVLVTISAPTTLAMERARAAGLTLVSLARQDYALLVSGSIE